MPPNSEALVQLAFMANPRKASATDSQKMVVTFVSEMAVRYNPKQQKRWPALHIQVRQRMIRHPSGSIDLPLTPVPAMLNEHC